MKLDISHITSLLMEKIKIIIPADFEQEIENQETGLTVTKREDYQATEADYQMNPIELLTNPDSVIMATLAILAIPSSLEGIFNFIERIKRYLMGKDSSRKITIQTSKHRYTFDGTTSEDTYKEIEEYFKKLADEGKLERKF